MNAIEIIAETLAHGYIVPRVRLLDQKRQQAFWMSDAITFEMAIIWAEDNFYKDGTPIEAIIGEQLAAYKRVMETLDDYPEVFVEDMERFYAILEDDDDQPPLHGPFYGDIPWELRPKTPDPVDENGDILF